MTDHPRFLIESPTKSINDLAAVSKAAVRSRAISENTAPQTMLNEISRLVCADLRYEIRTTHDIGCAKVSPDGQTHEAQIAELKVASAGGFTRWSPFFTWL